MLRILRIWLFDRPWYDQVFAFHRDGRWSTDDPAHPPSEQERKRRARWKIWRDNG